MHATRRPDVRRRPTIAPRRDDPRSLPLAGGRREPETRAWTERAERAHRVATSPRSPAGSRSAAGWTSCSRSARSACPTPARGRYFYQRRDGRQNQPVLYVREGVDGDGPRRCRSQRARCRRAPPRSTGIYPERRRPAAGLRPVRERQRAERAPRARRRHRRDPARPDPAHPRGRSRLAARRHRASTTPAIPRPARCPRARSTTTARSTSTGSAPIPADDPLVFQPAEKEYWPGVSLSPDGRWLRHRRRPHLRPDRSLPAGPRGAERRPGRRWPKDLPALVRGRGGARPAVPAHQPRCADLPAVRGGSRAARRAARWRELVPPRADAVLEGVRGRRRPPGAQLPRAGLVAAPARRPRRRNRAARSRCPTLGSLFGVGARVGRRRAVLRLLVLHRAARASTGSTSRPASQTLWRRVEADVDPERFEVRQVSYPLAGRHPGLDVPGAPQRARRATATTRPISPATADSTSA